MQVKSVLITGTTSGVGLALLQHYVRRGVGVIAVNRRRIQELESLYPRVRFECADVRSADAVDQLLRRLTEAGELPDVFILNAGINRIDNDEAFELESYHEVIDTNLYGALNFIQPITRLAAGHVPRHLIAVSSMANYVGNPYGLGYYTSKKALTACFEVWSRMYSGTDLVFQQVMLGPVRTAIFTMSGRFPPWMAWLKDALSAPLDATARAISRFATSRRRKLFYPPQAVLLYLGIGLWQWVVPGFFRGRKTLAGRRRRVPVET